MKLKTTSRIVAILITLSLLFSLVSINVAAAPAVEVTFTILHTNDFHGQLEASNADPNKASNPGMARTANAVNVVRAAKGAENVLLVDAGDEMQGSLLSNLGDGTATGKGKPTIATYNAMGYNVATFGNHEFDWGQVNLGNRTTEATYPYVTANIVVKDGVDCATSGWTPPTFADGPYEILTVGTAPDAVKVAFIGVTTTETPTITVSTATAGICFKDPAESILHYYDAMKADGADVIVVLSHLGYEDGGYGYGLPAYGDKSLAGKLNTAGKPVNLIIGGHSHTNLSVLGTGTPATIKIGSTTVTQAYYNGRRIGEADITVATDGTVTINWKTISWTIPTAPATTPPANWRLAENVGGSVVTADFTDSTKDATVDGVIATYATDPGYLTLVNTPIGYSAVDLGRSNTTDNMMGAFIDDAIYNYLNTDAEPVNDVDLFFNNAGGIRTDWCWNGTAWVTTGCVTGTTHDPALLTYGNMFTVLPFGNATIVGDMTGEQIMEVVNYGPNVAGVIQPAGLEYKYYSYKDANPGPQPFAWGAYDICVTNKGTGECDPLDLKKTYRVGTNEFLAPAGGDGYGGFKYMTNITYWGDMLNAVNAYVTAQHGTPETAYRGPNNDGALDGRIFRNGTDAVGSGDIIPITVLHHNDMHGNLAKGTYVGYTQLATLIKQERLHNPIRTLLLNSGDDIQGDGMVFFYKTSYTGKAVDGTDLDPSLWTNPVMAVMNSMNYDAMTLGNHEYNFGSDVFKGVLGQAAFPILQANVAEDPLTPYGLADVGVEPYVEKNLDGINIAILGIGNHRIPNYELPSNIPGLTFSNPLTKAQELSALLRDTNDVVLALTHIGFTEDPKSVEVDANVDTNLAATVTGLDAIVGGHSHTNPASGFGNYKYLPTFVVGPDDATPVIIGQAYRYNNTLGEIVLGVRAKVGGGYEVVTRSGRYLSVATATVEDAATKAIVDPYLVPFNTYNNTVIGDTNAPIDALQAYTQETTGANLQADAAVEALRKNNTVDFHLSGAMTNKAVATAGPFPFSLKVLDMFTVMPYENSLVVLSMNGPELKAVLERAYRNYYYYKYVTGYGGYSYYTTCMLDINSGGKITYNDLNPALPNGNNVISLVFDKAGIPTTVDFTDALTHYNVSTVNYLAAGSCNFNNGGVTLWPLDSIVADTQLYVRDAVIDYIKANTPVSPAVEGRLSFVSDTTPPTITIIAPTATAYLHPASLALDFVTTDDISGVTTIEALLDGAVVKNGQDIDLYTLALGDHTFTVNATDKVGNASTQSVTFSITATIDSLKTAVDRFYQDGSIKNKGVYKGLMEKLTAASKSTRAETTSAILNAFILRVKGFSGRQITTQAANLLIADAKWVITHLPDATQPFIVIQSPWAISYPRSHILKVDFAAFDMITGVKEVTAALDGASVNNGQKIDLFALTLGSHTLTVNAVDYAGNTATKSVTFKVVVTIKSLKSSVERFYKAGNIDDKAVYHYLLGKLADAEKSHKTSDVVKALTSFIAKVQQQSGTHITTDAANQLIGDAQWLIDNLKK